MVKFVIVALFSFPTISAAMGLFPLRPPPGGDFPPPPPRLGADVSAPEIDVASGVGPISLLAAVIALMAERSKKK
jgi:hypothetical protein